MREVVLKLQEAMGNLQLTISKKALQCAEKLVSPENFQTIGVFCLLHIVYCQLITG